MKLTQITGPNLEGQKPKGRNNSVFYKERITSLKPGIGDLKHSNLKKNNEKAEKYCTNDGTNQKHRSPSK